MSLVHKKYKHWNPRLFLFVCHDVIMATLSFFISLYVRLGSKAFNYSEKVLLTGALTFTCVAFVVVAGFRLYRWVWRYTSITDLFVIFRSATLTILLFIPVLFIVTRLENYPRSVIVINWFVLILLWSAPRVFYRYWKDHNWNFFKREIDKAIPVLLVGTGDESDIFIREMRHRHPAPYKILGIIDDKGTRVGRIIHGIEILGDVSDLTQVVQKLNQQNRRPERLIISRDRLKGDRLKELLNLSDELALPVSKLGKLTDFSEHSLDGGYSLKPVPIEDLLGRPQQALDLEELRSFIQNKRVLVTGAGGSIGSELVRQVASYAPASLHLLDASEYALYSIDLECREKFKDINITPILADVRDAARIDSLFENNRYDIVFHAAALKHVPMVEAHGLEGVATNVLGTKNVADSAVAHGCQRMILISTDKAINPTNIMGASKRTAELYCQALDIEKKKTQFVTVRFGNVLGSTGSVVPLFQHQIAGGGPITVTHPDVTRYFMTIREAVGLVLQAAAHHKGGQEGRIYVLDMGEPVKIVDLARKMIRLSGLVPDKDIQIVFSGLRPGEKLFEELFYDAEDMLKTDHPAIHLAKPRTVTLQEIGKSIQKLEALIKKQDQDSLSPLLQTIILGYKPHKN